MRTENCVDLEADGHPLIATGSRRLGRIFLDGYVVTQWFQMIHGRGLRCESRFKDIRLVRFHIPYDRDGVWVIFESEELPVIEPGSLIPDVGECLAWTCIP